MVKLAVSGAMGKIGSRIINLAKNNTDFKVVCILEYSTHPDIGKKFDGVELTSKIDDIAKCDCLIEFTTPDATIEHLKACVKLNKPMVIGTTGIDNNQLIEIREASRKIPIVYSPNMSVGVNVLFKLLEEASQKLKNGYSVKIIEAHHIHKKDAPSGTAKKLKEIIENQNLVVSDIESIREGEIFGDHRVIFEGPFDKIELFHSAKTRDIFVEGALYAAKWIINKKPSLYSMLNVLEV